MHEVDLDAPAEPQTRSAVEPRLRRSAGLVAAGTVLLAAQQVLGPMISFRIFAGADSATSETWADTWTVAFIGSFVVGVSLLVVGGFRFAAHVRVLAELALQRAAEAPAPVSAPRG